MCGHSYTHMHVSSGCIDKCNLFLLQMFTSLSGFRKAVCWSTNGILLASHRSADGEINGHLQLWRQDGALSKCIIELRLIINSELEPLSLFYQRNKLRLSFPPLGTFWSLLYSAPELSSPLSLLTSTGLKPSVCRCSLFFGTALSGKKERDTFVTEGCNGKNQLYERGSYPSVLSDCSLSFLAPLTLLKG